MEPFLPPRLWAAAKGINDDIAVKTAAFIMEAAAAFHADAIVFEASLSFISAGIQEPTPTWGTTVSKMKKDLKTYTGDAKHFSRQLYSIVCGCLGHRLERGWERGCWDGGEETHTSSSC